MGIAAMSPTVWLGRKSRASLLTIDECGPDCSTRRISSSGAANLLCEHYQQRAIPGELSRSVPRHDRFATASVARSDSHRFPLCARVGHTPDPNEPSQSRIRCRGASTQGNAS